MRRENVEWREGREEEKRKNDGMKKQLPLQTHSLDI